MLGAAPVLIGAAPVTAAAPAPLRVLIEPAAGTGTIAALFSAARSSVDLVVYELDDPRLEAVLAADAARGVRVRVLLDRKGEAHNNAAAFRFLVASGVAVRWAPSHFALTHEKAAVVDGDEALVMTLNLVARDYPATRDFAVLDRQGPDVSAIDAVFDRDWRGGAGGTPSGADLLWSPGAEAGLLRLIDGARRQLLLENEEMDEPYVTTALADAARRGVEVEVVMTAGSEEAAAFGRLARAGALVRLDPRRGALYVHAKAIVADPGTAAAHAYVGSQNFSVQSLFSNRELGILTGAAAVTAPVAATIEGDFASATPWRAS